MQHLCHAMHRTRCSLKRDLNEVAFLQSLGQLQQASIHRNCLDFAFGALAVLKFHEGRSVVAKLNAGCAMLRMRLGEMSHSSITMAYPQVLRHITKGKIGPALQRWLTPRRP